MTFIGKYKNFLNYFRETYFTELKNNYELFTNDSLTC